MQENTPISTLTTMKIGGPTRYLKEIFDPRQIAPALDFAKENSLPIFILGGGTNTFATDTGFSGLILRNKIRGIEILRQVAGEIIISGGSGETLDSFIAFGTKRGYSGMEAISGVPGTLGAAPVQNVGAYGQEISQVLDSVDVFDTRTGRFETIDANQLKLSYRKSVFNSGPSVGRFFITRVTVRLKKTHLEPPFYTSLQNYIDSHKISDFSPENIREAVLAVRAAKLPDPTTIPSSGSFFKNVILSDTEATKAEEAGIQVWRENGKNTVNSGWLIEEAGLKGQEFFGFRVWDKASLILVNESATSYADLDKARQHIIDTVKAKFGYTLEQEPVEISP